MIDALFVFAVLIGCVGAWGRDRAAIALLASTALSSLLIWAQVPFNLAIWLLIDIAVIAVIASRRLSVADMLILVLFIPAWVFYAVAKYWVPDAITLIVSLQLLLTFRLGNLKHAATRLAVRWKATLQYRREWTDLDRRGAHE